MTNELKLQTGRTVWLRELRQRETYEGLLNGLPTKEGNQRLLVRLVKDERCERYSQGPYIIAPIERAIEMPEGEEYPFGTPSALPSVTCICRLESVFPTTPGNGDASGLVVVWFQDLFQYPPPTDIESHLKTIDWENNAGNFEY